MFASKVKDGCVWERREGWGKGTGSEKGSKIVVETEMKTEREK